MKQPTVLSADLFAPHAEAINSGGGFSVKAAGGKAGIIAKRGYMVGMAGYGHDFPAGDVTPHQLHDYAQKNVDTLRKPGVYMGGWQGSDPVRASVDVSRKFPRSDDGLTRARDAAVTANQEAIGIVTRSGNYAGDINYPYYDSSAGHAQRNALTLFDNDWINTGRTDEAFANSKRK